MNKDFWRSANVALIGGGSWGTVLANLAAENCSNVNIWVRQEEVARELNSTRANAKYLPDLKLSDKVTAFSEMGRVFEKPVDCVIWALPSKATRENARAIAQHFDGHEIIIHATKGVEQKTLKRMSTVLSEEIPCRRIGTISGPNLAMEVAKADPAATVVASKFSEVVEAGRSIFGTPLFRVYGSTDVEGVEWAGVLKNVLAIASGSLDAMEFGWNVRAMLISRGLAEMARFGTAMGGRFETFAGLAGVGDLLATCCSVLSRNYRVGFQLGEGKKIDEILESLGSTAEGVQTATSVWNFARERKIPMPIVEAVYRMINGEMDAREALKFLMMHPTIEDVV